MAGRSRARRKTVGGVTYRSQFEATLATTMGEQGLRFEYESGSLLYTLEKVYMPDFRIAPEDSATGREIFIEAKGWFKPEDRTKMLAVRRSHPDVDIRIVLQRGRAKSTGKLTHDGRWCERHRFVWADGTVPREWFKQ